MHHYIVRMHDREMFLIGPFASQAEAEDYGIAKLAPGGIDDPRWQTIELADAAGKPFYSVPILHPDHPNVE